MTIFEQIRTISNPVRFEILQVLKQNGGPMQAGDISGLISHDVSVPMVSQHLSKLRLNKLILKETLRGRPQYRLNKDAVTSVLRRLEALG